MRTIHRLSVAVLCVVCVAALTGCLSADVGVTVDADGSGTMTIDMTLTEAATALVTLDGQVPLDELEGSFAGDLGASTDVDVTVDGGQLRITATAAFDDPDELAEMLTAPTGSFEALFATFELTAGDGTWTLDGTTTNDLDSSAALDSSDIGFDLEGFGDLAPTATLSVTFPGAVTEANTDDVDGATATWDLTTVTDVHAEASTSNAGVPATAAVAAALVVGGLLGGLAVALWSRRRRSAATDPAGADDRAAVADTVADGRDGTGALGDGDAR